MKSLRHFTSILILLYAIGINSQNKEVQITVQKLTKSVYMLTGQGGNIGLFIGTDGAFMIDAQFAPLTPKILAVIKTVTDKPVTYLINTHWHGDHVGGNVNMYNEGAIIVSHENVRKRMSEDQIIKGKKKRAALKEALPVITFEKDMMFHLNGDDILITHVHNAHTDGDAFVYFTRNNVLHMGDAYFSGKFPYIDLSSGGSIDGYISGIKKAIMMSDKATIIICGHGKISNRTALKKYLIMLQTLRKRVLSEIKKGKSLEEVRLNKQLTKEYSAYIGWITEERILTAIFTSLKKK